MRSKQDDMLRRRFTKLMAFLAFSPLVTNSCSRVAVAHSHGLTTRQEVKRLVIEEAKQMRVSISLALAVAHVESNFNPRALSLKGARGVMQIMPFTAKGEYGIAADLLWHPRINVRLGLNFLRRLLKRYDGRSDLALSYYNGGSAVGDLPDARVIPITARYIAKVYKMRRYYRRQLRRGDT